MDFGDLLGKAEVNNDNNDDDDDDDGTQLLAR